MTHKFSVFRSGLQLLFTGDFPSSLILFTLMMEVIHYSLKPIVIRATRPNVPKDGILHVHCRENLKSFNMQWLL
jgi:hypothetical protein